MLTRDELDNLKRLLADLPSAKFFADKDNRRDGRHQIVYMSNKGQFATLCFMANTGDEDADSDICNAVSGILSSAPALIAMAAENAKYKAIANAGHREDCAGMDTAASECGCGYLQRQAANEYIEQLEAENAKLRGEVAAEREACAKGCECQAEACIKMATDTAIKDVSLLTVAKWYRNNAAAIRSRSQTPNGGEVGNG